MKNSVYIIKFTFGGIYYEKKIAFLLSATIFCSLLTISPAALEDKSISVDEYVDIAFSAGEHRTDVLIVALKASYSGYTKQFSKEEFPGLNVEYVENITSQKENADKLLYLNHNVYYNIVGLIFADDTTDEQLREYMKEVAQLEIVNNVYLDYTDFQLASGEKKDDTKKERYTAHTALYVLQMSFVDMSTMSYLGVRDTLKYYDVDGDKKCTVNDALLILQYSVKKIDNFPAIDANLYKYIVHA